MTRHVVFGTGQVGAHLVRRLVADGHDVVGVSRTGRSRIEGASMIGGDATDASFTRSVTAGADVVYFCLNPGSYRTWEAEFPPLQRGVLDAAAHVGARLVVLDNLYSYGRSGGHDLVESARVAPTSAKGATRAAMTTELLTAHDAGRVEVAIGRASDYFGPGTPASALGDGVFGAAVRGATAQVMGDPHLEHSYSYTPDVAAALATLGSDAAAPGRIWHLPVTEPMTIRAMVERIYAAAGRPPRLYAAGRTALTLVGLVRPDVREYLHTLSQFTERWVVDDGAFRRTFGPQLTPLDEAIAETLQWFRDRGAIVTTQNRTRS
jgi:nucleoside-diphosphate-sugar epimerase